MSKLFVMFVFLSSAVLMPAGGKVKINYTPAIPPGYDPDYILNIVTPLLEQKLTPVRDEITIVFDDSTSSSYGDPCSGKIPFGSKGKPRDAHDFWDSENIALIHEYIHARFTPCTIDSTLVEGWAEAAMAWLYRQLPASASADGIVYTSIWEAVPKNNGKWLAYGGSSSFHSNMAGYTCSGGPLELLGAPTSGDYREIDQALAGKVTREDNLSAFKVAPRINGVLPETYLGATRCMWVNDIYNGVAMKDVLGFTTDGKFFQTQDPFGVWENPTGFDASVVERINGRPSYSTPPFDLHYKVTDLFGKLVAEETVRGVSSLVRYLDQDAFLRLPSGAYKRETCVLVGGVCDSSLSAVTYFVVYRGGGDWKRKKMFIVTNGPSWEDFDARTSVELSGSSRGLSVEKYSGLLVVNNPVGNVEMTDGRKTRIFTSSETASVVDYWTQFDDTFFMGIMDLPTYDKWTKYMSRPITESEPVQSFETKTAVTPGEEVILFTVGATHNDPTEAQIGENIPTEGCVGEQGTTRVAFLPAFGGKTYAGVKFCSQDRIRVVVPNLPSGPTQVFVELNAAVSNSMEFTVVGGTPPRIGISRGTDLPGPGGRKR